MRIARPLALAGVAGAALLTFSTPATALEVAPTCPAGSQGVVISHGGSTTYVCTTAVSDVKRIVGDITVADCRICEYVEWPPPR